jgi:hypothetical protein
MFLFYSRAHGVLIWCLSHILRKDKEDIKMNTQSLMVLLGIILAMPVYAEEYINDGLSSQATTYMLAANADTDTDGIDTSNMEKSNVDSSNLDVDNMDTGIDTSNMDTTGMDTSNMDAEMDESDMDTSNMD